MDIGVPDASDHDAGYGWAAVRQRLLLHHLSLLLKPREAVLQQLLRAHHVGVGPVVGPVDPGLVSIGREDNRDWERTAGHRVCWCGSQISRAEQTNHHFCDRANVGYAIACCTRSVSHATEVSKPHRAHVHVLKVHQIEID